ncbi:MAG: hypothetical protein H7836_04075 [Magnetococcus sp. YQC-3]
MAGDAATGGVWWRSAIALRHAELPRRSFQTGNDSSRTGPPASWRPQQDGPSINRCNPSPAVGRVGQVGHWDRWSRLLAKTTPRPPQLPRTVVK